MRKISTTWKILTASVAIVLVALTILHLYFASWALGYVNRYLANLNGYEGSAQNLGIDLFRGAYRVDNLVIKKKSGAIPAPFVTIKTVDFTIQWGALFHGRIVSGITLERPVINFAVNKSDVQNGEGVDWTKAIKDLVPIDINHVRFRNGSITFQNFSSTPPVNIYIHNMSGEIKNLRNVVDAEKPLPSTIDITGGSIGNGGMKIHGRMNILKDIPDMDMLAALENAELPAINSFSEAYAAFDFKSGEFSLYTHIVLKNGQIGGYIKPVATHLSVDILKTANPLQVAWDTAIAAILKVFTNPAKDQFATRADLEGNVSDVRANPWSTLGGIIRNAFISTMNKGFDETGDENALQAPENSSP